MYPTIMRIRSHLSHSIGAVISTLTLLVFALAFQLDAMRPPHAHGAETAGIYNEEHVLAELGSLHRIVSLPEGAPAIILALRTTAAVVSARVHPRLPDASRAGPRAPPSA
ncbi:MAG TPA: hypothetical protein VNU02_06530 [Candidatus Dormibacteraeota bacterium]|nr:hypothetical protein [Candidatus Dormibacteraeota bacterium]